MKYPSIDQNSSACNSFERIDLKAPVLKIVCTYHMNSVTSQLVRVTNKDYTEIYLLIMLLNKRDKDDNCTK